MIPHEVPQRAVGAAGDCWMRPAPARLGRKLSDHGLPGLGAKQTMCIGEPVTPGVADDPSPCLLPMGRGEANAPTIGAPAVRSQASAESSGKAGPTPAPWRSTSHAHAPITENAATCVQVAASLISSDVTRVTREAPARRLVAPAPAATLPILTAVAAALPVTITGPMPTPASRGRRFCREGGHTNRAERAAYEHLRRRAASSGRSQRLRETIKA
jgi:hypothetical protein